MEKLKIKNTSLAERCEICHQSDCFDPSLNRCSRCSALIINNLGAVLPASPSRPPIARPQEVTIEYQDNNLRLTESWRDQWFILYVCLIGMSFVVVPSLIKVVPVFALFALPYAIANIYIPLAYIINHSVITVSRGQISIKHGPLPWPNNIHIPASEITQLYTQEYYVKANALYRLRVKLKNGTDRKLLGSIAKKEVSLYLEQRIEEYLGIRDVPVSGEVPR